MKVVWTERAWERLTEIEAFVARDHPEAAVRRTAARPRRSKC